MLTPNHLQSSRLKAALAALSLLCLLLTGSCRQDAGDVPHLSPKERQWLKDHGRELVIVPHPGYAPIEYFDAQGRFMGLTADYLHLLERRLNCKFTVLKLSNWQDGLAKAKAGQVAIVSAATPSPDKLQYLLFTRPYLELTAALVVHSDSLEHLTLETLRDRPIAAVEGDFTYDYLKQAYPELRLVPVRDAAAGLRAVAFKNVEALLIDTASANALAEREGLTSLRVEHNIDLTYGLAFASLKDWPILHHILDAGLASITPEERREIHDRWLPSETGWRLPRHRFLWIAGLPAVLLLLGLGGTLLWRRCLARVVGSRTQELTEQNSLLQSILTSAPNGIGLAVGSRLVWFNQQFAELTGYPPEELNGLTLGRLYPDEATFQQWRMAQAAQLKRDRRSVMETRWRRKDGSRLDILLCTAWLDPAREEAGVTIAVQDIGARKLAERELESALAQTEAEKEKNKAILAALGDGVSIQGRDFRVLYQNEIHQGFIGDRAGEFCYRAYGNQESPCPGCPVAKSFEDGGIHSAERTGRRPDGGTRHVEITASPLRGTNGEIVAGIELVRDVTARKLAEKALVEETEKLAVTLQSIGDGVITTDTEGRVALLNAAAEEITGFRQEEAAGRPLLEVFKVVDAQTREAIASPVERVMQTGQATGLANQAVLIRRDGLERSIADSAAPIRDHSGEIIGVALVFRDTSSQTRLEQEFLKLKKLESVGILAGGIAHDFNNLLTAIIGNLNLASEILPANGKAQALISEAEKAALRAKDLTRQLLTFSKGGEPVRRPTAIAELIRETTGFVLREIAVRCAYDFPPNLWLAEIDKGQIGQVFQNLIINACQAMPEGGSITVRGRNLKAGTTLPPTLAADRDYLEITVCDSGPGIPPEIINSIFDPYFTTKAQGSGLGLAICHGIISKHDGAISVQSAPGEGATFTIHLPALRNSQAEERLAATTPLPQGQGRQVMVMDDDLMVQTVAQAMLSHLGYQVLLAKDGAEAIDLYREAMAGPQPVEMVFMDLSVPNGMGGREATEEILKLDPQARIIASSGYSEDQIMSHCRDYGFKAAIAKPYQLSDLAEVIRQVRGEAPEVRAG